MVMVWHVGEKDGGVRRRWFVEDIIGMSFGSRISKNLRKEKEKRNRKSNVPVVDLFVDFFVFGAIYRFAQRKACALLSSWKCAVVS